MHAVKRYIELKIQSKIGVNATVLIGVVVTLLAAVVTFVFALVIVFIWLAGRYSLFSAALIMFGLFQSQSRAQLLHSLHNARPPFLPRRPYPGRARFLSSNQLLSRPRSKWPTGLDGGDSFQSWEWAFSWQALCANSACATR